MVVPLDGEWRIAPDPQNAGRQQEWWRGPVPQARPTRVPWIIQAVFPRYHGVAWYWRRFQAPANPHSQGRYLLRFGAVDYLAEVWVNGVMVGGHEGGETPFVLDATGAIRPGEENLLAVRVLNPNMERIDGITLAETPHRNKGMPLTPGSSLNYGGIVESVELVLSPAARVEDLFVRADVHTGVIRAQARVRSDLAAAAAAVLEWSVAPAASGAALAAGQLERVLSPGDALFEVQVPLQNPRLWDLHDPFLYRVTTVVRLEEPEVRHEVSARCGFRDFRVERGYFRLNGRRVLMKSTHTGNHCPVGQVVPPAAAPDLLRRDLLCAKVSGFNTVRFIAGLAHPWQLDFCDEIGLMVYEEPMSSWCLADSPQMPERFDRSVAEMVQRDRNHPSVVVWGLLNETTDNPVSQRARASLPLIRSLDDTRLVLLSSGRWDQQFDIGSVCNPGRREWECVWGVETPGPTPAPPVAPEILAYIPGGGDVHMYPRVPHPPEISRYIRVLGQGTKPVLLSEYGIGSAMNVVRELRHYEQSGENLEAEDAALMRSMAEGLAADWQRFGMEGVYASPEEFLRHSQQLHCRQRLLGFDLIRSNPQICGYNLTGMLDHGMSGEGLWTFWREWKPGIADALSDGWASLRWCLFVEPLHGYAGRPFRVEAVLADEDALGPGEYPVRLRIIGEQGIVWERQAIARIPRPAAGEDPPLAVPVLDEEVALDLPPGAYECVVSMEQGGAPAGGRLRFHLSEVPARVAVPVPVAAWGIGEEAEAWLATRGVECARFGESPATGRRVVLVGDLEGRSEDLQGRVALLREVAQGSVAVFLSPLAFKRGEDAVGWLPLADKGRCHAPYDSLYHKECVAKHHPVFAGLSPRGIMDLDYYGPVMPQWVFADQDTPEEVIVASFWVAVGYSAGLQVAAYRFGAGRFVLNTLRVLENLDRHPAADRLLLNLVRYAAGLAAGPAVPAPPDFESQLRAVGYT